MSQSNNNMRANNRSCDALRLIKITRHFTKYAEGSVLIEFGETKVLCNASVIERVPDFLRDTGKGWVTAEYGMLPRATHTRSDREAAKGKQTGRTQEIQRLIGRSLRAAFHLEILGQRTLHIDCDVIQADGGTRTASITGAYIAAQDAITHLMNKKIITKNPIHTAVAAISVGLKDNQALLDLDYLEDSTSDTDMNIVMTEHNGLIEVQGTAEKNTFSEEQMTQLLALAKKGIQELIAKQKIALEVTLSI